MREAFLVDRALGCIAIIPASVWTCGAPVLSVGTSCLRVSPGAVDRGGVGLASSPIPHAEQGDSSSKVKTAASTEARDSLLDSLC